MKQPAGLLIAVPAVILSVGILGRQLDPARAGGTFLFAELIGLVMAFFPQG
jgi:hypothetical protein